MFREGGNQQQSNADGSDKYWYYPTHLGRGSIREIKLREGLELTIASYQLYQNLIVEIPEREHPLEYEFTVIGEHHRQLTGADAENYFFSGSGLADKSVNEYLAGWQVLNVSFHLEPDLFRTWIGDRLEQAETIIQELLKDLNSVRYTHTATPTVKMQTALQQILYCPYRGIIQQIYLESKVWELMALHLEQMLQNSSPNLTQPTLKPDDIERIHHAREILSQCLCNPPSLKGLARQVGLNEFTLKQGFRQVFGTTAFGWLHHHRMERVKELLETGHYNVTEAAREVGFSNRGHFAASFRKKFGVNPKAYSLFAKQPKD
ncbi:helix-turn-helix transcriptional regulator [Synechocystis sp. PCC 6803]|nr:AraC family transcriptional regulator [Synechocystis sp. PCC 6803]